MNRIARIASDAASPATQERPNPLRPLHINVTPRPPPHRPADSPDGQTG